MRHIKQLYWFLHYVFQVIYDDGDGTKVRADVRTAWKMAGVVAS